MRTIRVCLMLLSWVIVAVVLTTSAHAQTESEVQSQIDDRTNKISQLQQEIAQLQKQLDQTGEQKQTLQTAIKSLDLSRKKLTAQITLTQTQISRTDLQIKTLSGGIATTTERIGTGSDQVGEILRNLNATDHAPPALALLGRETLGDFFTERNALGTIRDELQLHIRELSALKSTLEDSKRSAKTKRDELSALNKTLSGQKQALTAAIASQNQLLAETKNKEGNFQALITQKKEEEERFENELRQLEAQLGLTVTSSQIPTAGAGILSWPFDASYMAGCSSFAKALGNSRCLTQYFGNTPFATANPQIYGYRGHNAVDFRAPDGTPIKASRNGAVQATGNTDAQRGCYSYGKWVLIQHTNGLSTLYAHLSVISVSPGENVATGQLLGYSGRTGYATGPHLHFGVFASAGVKVARFTNSVNCKQVDVPLVDPTAYLNPLSYL